MRRTTAALWLAAGLAAGCATPDTPPPPAPGAGRALGWYDRAGRALEAINTPQVAWRHIWLDPTETLAFGIADASASVWKIDLASGAVMSLQSAVRLTGAGDQLNHLGTSYVVFTRPGESQSGLWVAPIADMSRATPFPGEDVPARDGRLSADERWLAYVSAESGLAEVYATTFPDADARWLMSDPAGGSRPVWRSDSQELYYWAPGGRLMRVPLRRGDRFVLPGGATPVFDNPGLADAPVAVTRDATRFLIAVTP